MAGDACALPAVPRHGLSLAALRAFVAAHAGRIFEPAAAEAEGDCPLPFETLTTAQVVHRVIKPATLHTSGSYAELLQQQSEHGSSEPRLVAPANVFISHAWQYRFTDLLEAVLSYLAAEESTAYVWLDIFVGSQHKAAELPQEWWSRAFAQAVGDIGRTVVVLQPWNAPLPLKRSWCLWELFSTVDSGSTLEMTIHPREADDFGAALLDDKRAQKIFSDITSIDTRNAQAFLVADKVMIDAAVEASANGFGTVNAMILEQLRAWLARSALQLQEKLVAQLGELHPDTLTAMFRSASLLLISGKLDDAAPLLERVVSGRISTLGPAHADVFKALCIQSYVWMHQGKVADAEALSRTSLHDAEAALGAEHVQTASLRNNLALILQRDTGTLDEAVALKKQALRDIRASCGDDDPLTIMVLTSYAYVLQKKGELVEAEQLYRQALAKQLALRGARHVETLGVINLIAQLLREQDKLAEAEPLCRQALAGQRETLGDSHPHTLDSMRNLAALLRARGQPEQAMPLAEECVRRCREKYGADHRDTAKSAEELAAVREALARGEGAEHLAARVAAASLD